MMPEPLFGEVAALQTVFEDVKKRRSARHPAHVLIVEDDPVTRRVVSSTLSDSHALISEENAHNAVVSYLLHAPDIVFLDIGLPDIDGLSVLEQIMTLDPDAFVVMFSSHNDEKTVKKALGAGAKGFVSKPFKKETLYRYIQGSSLYHLKA